MPGADPIGLHQMMIELLEDASIAQPRKSAINRAPGREAVR